MQSFILLEDRVIAYDQFGLQFPIFLSPYSGKVYYRYKVDTVMQVKHPGVYLGYDNEGTHYYIHNHWQIGGAAVVTGRDFAKGMPLYLYKEKCSNLPRTVIKKALEQVEKGERYHFVTYNCQTFVHDSCDNQRKSPDVEKVIGTVALGFLGILFLAAIASE